MFFYGTLADVQALANPYLGITNNSDLQSAYAKSGPMQSKNYAI